MAHGLIAKGRPLRAAAATSSRMNTKVERFISLTSFLGQDVAEQRPLSGGILSRVQSAQLIREAMLGSLPRTSTLELFRVSAGHAPIVQGDSR